MTDDERAINIISLGFSLITICLLKFTLGLSWVEAVGGFVIGTSSLAALNVGIRLLFISLTATLGL